MTTEKHDPWALLREAREALVQAENRMMAPPHRVPDAIRRIDAALAEREAEETVDVVWVNDTGNTHTSDLKNVELNAYPSVAGGYAWSVWKHEQRRQHTISGREPTLDEAQRAALAAARGLK